MNWLETGSSQLSDEERAGLYEKVSKAIFGDDVPASAASFVYAGAIVEEVVVPLKEVIHQMRRAIDGLQKRVAELENRPVLEIPEVSEIPYSPSLADDVVKVLNALRDVK